ncbi:MAG: ferritin-like domain-containing protein [Lachnospiraceae bacterium]|nr:ferritin-like domain-containing protein [Lachnospiraceae bacterium]
MYDIRNSRFVQYDYDQWIKHFLKNDRHRLQMDFSEEKELSTEEKKLIFKSIAAFQKGEGSEGSYLLSASNTFAKIFDQSNYPHAMELFIREENWHSAYLARYMQFHQVEKQQKNFLDGVFRKLRQLGGIRSEVVVLVTAEIIALSYYTALANAASSPLLKKICGQILKDELPHIAFQSYTLSYMKNTLLHRLARILLMEITTVAVWIAYKDLFTAGDYSFRKLMNENLGYLKQSIQIASGKTSFSLRV